MLFLTLRRLCYQRAAVQAACRSTSTACTPGQNASASAPDLPPSPSLHDFIRQSPQPQHMGEGLGSSEVEASVGVGQLEGVDGTTGERLLGTMPAPLVAAKRVFIETYGCQMNINDTEVLLSVLSNAGYEQSDIATADLILVNTCAIRDNAERRVWGRLGEFKHIKQTRMKEGRSVPIVGVLGCMAERLKDKLLVSDRLVDLVVGPDAYRDVPRLVETLQGSASTSGRSTAINVQLSLEETYADIAPVRPAGAKKAFLSIMRGCDNMCSFCIVPFTRGRERSRPMQSILSELRQLSNQGVMEVTLLGQNVNSYADKSVLDGENTASSIRTGRDGARSEEQGFAVYAKGFQSVYRPEYRRSGAVNFAELLHEAALIDPEMRIRFTSPHPKDFSDDVLQVIATHPNICQQLHMPAQSGSTSMLQRMRRGYSSEAYRNLVQRVREVLQPQVALSTDIIVGFCGETDEEHQDTVQLMLDMHFEQAFMFKYSLRDRTHAARNYVDDVPPEVKSARLQDVMDAFKQGLAARNAQEIGRRHIVLVEGPSKKSSDFLTGRTCTFKRVVFPDQRIPANYNTAHAGPLQQGPFVGAVPGDYVVVEIIECGGGGTLKAKPLARTSLAEFVAAHGSTVPVGDQLGDCAAVGRTVDVWAAGQRVLVEQHA